MTRFASLLGVILILPSVIGCGSSKPEENGKKGRPKVEIEHPEGDPNVSAEDGGPGFTGEGWLTKDPGPIGDPDAVKGGTMLSNIRAWPDNLRMYGIRSNTWLNYLIRDMCYESLLSLDPRTMEFIPSLASHWKISEDKMKFTFRINPKAHWSDGKPVTADDVIATYKLIEDDKLLDPMSKAQIVEKMEEPVKKSKYIVEIQCKVKHWLNFYSISGMILLPAHEIGDLSGEKYLEEYNFKYTATTGPYIVYPEDIKNNESITMTRRTDWWRAEDPTVKRLYNIDRIRYVVVREDRLAFDKACKGELDFYPVFTAKWWVEDLPKVDRIKKGHMLRRKVYTKFPKGVQGLAINLRKKPLDDVRVRTALAHLFDRKTMLEKFAFNEYEPLSSFYPGSDYENHDNQLIEFNPMKAATLLAEAGWSERGPDNILVKAGERFSLTLTYSSKGLEKYFTVYKEACRNAGIDLKLELIDHETLWNNLQSRKFTIASMAWGATILPQPRTSWLSRLADKEGSNNFVGFKSDLADQLIEQYDEEFDLSKRKEILQELDAELYREQPYVLFWFLPCERIIYKNKFGMPDSVLLKYHEYEDALALWWVDPEKEKKLKEARKKGTTLPQPPIVVKPWDANETATAAAE